MGQIRVRWGKFRIDLPVEVFLFLLIKATSSLVHHVNM